MSGNFDCINAPQFFDFSKTRPTQEDTYFDVDHEEEDPLFLESLDSEYRQVEKELESHLRRSMSAGDVFYLETALDNNDIHHVRKKLEALSIKTNDSLQMIPSTSRNTANLQKSSSNASLNKQERFGPLNRTVSKDSLNRLAQPKRTFTSDQDLTKNSYIPMAEALRKFHNSTPERFHTKPKPGCAKSNVVKLTNTIPHSPNLMAKRRNRPVHILSQEEQEKIELEERKKFKIRANPVNKKMLHGPLKSGPVEKKPSTIIEPFKLTVPPKKIVESPKRSFEFTARPIPKYIHNPPTLQADRKIRITMPQTPSFMKQYNKEPVRPLDQVQLKQQPFKLAMTQPVPFSFEMRDKYNREKHEARILSVLEEEKKSRVFHARPIPKAVLKQNSINQSDASKSLQSGKQSNSEENLTIQFKARPATVLYKKPFEPKKPEKPLVEINEFVLKTDLRVKAREAFEQNIREKEEQFAHYRKMEELCRLEQEQEEITKLRRMMEYKAQPVRKYKEVKIRPSGKVTEPVSPKFHRNKLRNEDFLSNKENV